MRQKTKVASSEARGPNHIKLNLEIKANGKHVSRACLECRSRHAKCSGGQPCSRCTRLSRECAYVKSHRGGARKKGVSKFENSKMSSKVKDNIFQIDLTNAHPSSPRAASGISATEVPSNSPKRNSSREITMNSPTRASSKHSEGLGYYIPSVEDLIKLPCINHEKSANERKKDYEDLLKMPCAFTCLEPQYRGRTPPCMGGEVRVSPSKDIDLSKIPLKGNDSFYERVNSHDYVKNLMRDINIDDVIQSYYTHFHTVHPILPQRSEIKEYLEKIPHAYELIIPMKIMADAQSSTLYANEIETVNFKINQLFDYINTVVGLDIVSLQAMALLSLIAHFSSLHDLSSRIRTEAVRAIIDHGYNKIDMDAISRPTAPARDKALITPDSPESDKELQPTKSSKVLSSERLSKLSEAQIKEAARKVFWEFHFIDVVIGTADGRTISKLATIEKLVQYPHSVPMRDFDYKSRAEACHLVTESIGLNISVIEQSLSANSMNHLNISLGNWELRLSHPELLNAPLMVDANGRINEGVFQAMLLYNYARIFAHRPFSYLWKNMAVDIEEKLGSNKASINARKIIETRKTIEGANAIATCLLDTSPWSIKQRTPLYGCSIAFASLVHLSAYIWSKSTLMTMGNDSSLNRRGLEEEISQYAQYIQFELNTLSVISRHWTLANKLVTYVKDSLAKVVPELYDSIRESMPHLKEKSSATIAIEHEDDESVTSIQDPVAETSRNGRVLSFSDQQNFADTETPAPTIAPSVTDDANARLNPINEIDFTNYEFNSTVPSQVPGIPGSPMSDTGCDWIDRNVFEFDGDEFKNILEPYEQI